MEGTSAQRSPILREILAFTAAAFADRLAYLFAIGRVIDMADAIHYIAMARDFAAGNFLEFDENLPVLYPLLGAIAFQFTRDWEWAFWIVSLCASSLLVAPVYVLSNALHGRIAARVAAAVVCVWPWLVDYGSRIAPEALAVTLWFASIALLHAGLNGRRAALALAPASLFALHLTRPEGTFLMLGAPVAGAILCWKRDAACRRNLAVFAGACVLLLALYAVAMRFLIGTFTVSYRAPMVEDLDDYFQRGAIEFARTFMRLLFDVFPVMLGPFLLAFAAIGAYADRPDARNVRLEWCIVFFCSVQWGLTLANFSPAPRYLMAVVVAVSLWSARGIVVLAGAAPPRLRHWPAAAVFLTLLLGHAASLAPEYLGRMPGLPREYKLAGQWMRANLEPGVVLCRKPQVGFYADMPSTGPADGDDVPGVIARAVAIGARYLVVDERYGVGISPGLKPLLDPANAPPELRLLSDDLSPWPGAKIVIYEIAAPGIVYTAPENWKRSTSHRGPDTRRRNTPAK